GLDPEELLVYLRDQVVTFETLSLVERVFLESHRSLARGPQSLNLLVKPIRAPIRQLPVKFVTTRVYGRVRARGEVVIQILIDETVPLRCGSGRRILVRLLHRVLLATNKRRNERKQ